MATEPLKGRRQGEELCVWFYARSQSGAIAAATIGHAAAQDAAGFYKGKTVTIIAGSACGGVDHLCAPAWSPFPETHSGQSLDRRPEHARRRQPRGRAPHVFAGAQGRRHDGCRVVNCAVRSLDERLRSVVLRSAQVCFPRQRQCRYVRLHHPQGCGRAILRRPLRQGTRGGRHGAGQRAGRLSRHGKAHPWRETKTDRRLQGLEWI